MAATTTEAPFLDFLVMVGSKGFTFGGPWPEYITSQLDKGISNSAGGVARQAQDFLKSVSQYVEHFHGTRPWNGQVVNDSNRLQVRSGGTIEAFKRAAQVKQGDKLEDIEIRHDVGMFGIHLDGGVIRARRSKYLTIPLPPACDRRGVPLKASARDWPDTFVIRSKKGNLLIVHKVNGQIEPLYLLKSSVRIPPRLQDFPKVWDSYLNRFEKALVEEIERCIDDIKW